MTAMCQMRWRLSGEPLCRGCSPLQNGLLATVALFFVLVAFGNITDYGTNWQFVRHVLAMDTIFPDSTLTWRAITDKVVAVAYWLIIAWEAATAIILIIAVVRLAAACRIEHRFADAKPLAILRFNIWLGALRIWFW